MTDLKGFGLKVLFCKRVELKLEMNKRPIIWDGTF